MFSLVALMCFYLGTSNIRKAFSLAPFADWGFINRSLFVTGVILIPVGVFCVLQAIKDLKEKQAQKEERQKIEAAKRQRQFFYDEKDVYEDSKEVSEEFENGNEDSPEAGVGGDGE